MIIHGDGRGFKVDPVATEAWRELASDTAAAGSLNDDQKAAVKRRVLDWKQKHALW